MTYQETLQYLFVKTPMFQQVGAKAYKPGLQVTETLDAHLGHPHRNYATIHVAGTNGKGSTAHLIAATLQSAGLRVGLYTSPHLVDFRERIRVNGEPVSEEYVVDFVERERGFFEPLRPSFFEITTAMALRYFADAEVDVAVIEVGLGGRLDCTNIISPVLSVITNISLEHTALLGSTLAEIAAEKGGIIKPATPVVIGERTPETAAVFSRIAEEKGAPLFWADEDDEIIDFDNTSLPADGCICAEQETYATRSYGTISSPLTGRCQRLNARTVLCALRRLPFEGITKEAVAQGFRDVERLTGLRGRWQTVAHRPLTICDVGHNPGGLTLTAARLSDILAAGKRLHLVFGMAEDKDISTVLRLLPHPAPNHHIYYYWTQASVRRALPADRLKAIADASGLTGGTAFPDVPAAYAAARAAAAPDDVVFVGGSCFIVADFLGHLQ